ncbi:MAG: hypothetical protein P1V97_06775 [Planctomycetota bacterium]|nr:hypothetical protein [Planctomycetota bacterium]
MEYCSDCGMRFQKRVVCGRQSWRCQSCDRVLVGFAVLKQTHKRLVTRLHYRSNKYNRLSPYHCVACGTPWQRIFDDDYKDYLEICKICQWAWLPADFDQKLGPEEKNWNDIDPYEQREAHHNEVVNQSYREIQKQGAMLKLQGVKERHQRKHSITRRILNALSDDPAADAGDIIRYLGMLLQSSVVIGLGYYAFKVVGFQF